MLKVYEVYHKKNMKPSDHQSQIIKYLSTVESATKKEIYDNVKFGYYHNWEKHLGDTLSRMVNRGFIFRVKKGLFSLTIPKERIIKEVNIGLFDYNTIL
mgnify:CR=1 FL=1